MNHVREVTGNRGKQVMENNEVVVGAAGGGCSSSRSRLKRGVI